eukprot:CAMPEP_0174253890 /NCGR_PEP_ID=MMETSP0439-20130205/3257_1 /TAXON_ID=0 /ORGANISM="Stereomyxa ramosa, Strain Chinc5" /LENGTH=381 /DNA_ID=CAMNT_0015335189 /DNA_START=47 /DNA_END=1189 /DNA_ORIENTATION=-
MQPNLGREANWAKNYEFSQKGLFYPKTVEDIQSLVKTYPDAKFKVLGSRHCFNDIADTSGYMLCLTKYMNNILHVDQQNKTVCFEGGITYAKLCEEINKLGYALPNMASLPHISVVGAVGTATHGSGHKLGNLGVVVKAIEFVDARANLVSLSSPENEEEIQKGVVGLGGYGIITKMTLEMVPAFRILQYCYVDLSFDYAIPHFYDIMQSAYSVSLFTQYYTGKTNVVVKRNVEEESEQFPEQIGDATRSEQTVHPIPGGNIDCCTEQGKVGSWHERLPHFKPDFMPSAGEELQSEYFVGYKYGKACLRTIVDLFAARPALASLLLISEVRTIAPDSLLLSPCRHRKSVAFHFTWRKDEKVLEMLPMLEEAIERYEARPHW